MSLEQPHPISLIQVFFVRSVVVANAAHVPSEATGVVAPTNSLAVQAMEGNERLYQAQMRCTLDPNGDPAQPYMIDMECVGNFEVDDTLTPEDAHRGVTITAHHVLYGAIREAVSWLTGRQPYGSLTLGLSVLKPKSPAPASAE